MSYDGLNRAFTDSVRALQVSRDRTNAEINGLYMQGVYTSEYRYRETDRLCGELKAEMDAKIEEVKVAVISKNEELDSRERHEFEVRSLDTDYTAKLNSKIDVVSRLIPPGSATPAGVDIDYLKAYFAEFADDPIAIKAISNRFGMAAVRFLPEDSSGKLQRHLLDVFYVFTLVAKQTTEVVLPHGVGQTVDVSLFTKGVEDAFIAYCLAQDSDFSLNDIELIQELVNKDPSQYDGLEWVRMQLEVGAGRTDTQAARLAKPVEPAALNVMYS